MNERTIIIRALVIVTAIVLSVRLFSIQIVDETYKAAAQNNIINKIIEYPYRGLIYDRNGELLVFNEPVYDVMIVPREVKHVDSVIVCQLLEITQQEYEEGYANARQYSAVLPSIFYGQLSNEHFARIQDQLIGIDGFHVQPRTIRGYAHQSLANALGYVGQITRRQLNRDTTGYYRGGDNIGIAGLERQYEEELRGRRGVSIKTVDVRGRVMGPFENGEFDSASVPGQDIQLTIDIGLQAYAEQLLKNKIGSVVAIDPATGEILVMVSSPSYSPEKLAGRKFSSNYLEIEKDSLKPLFNRPLQAMYPPGSMFKTIQALTAMQDKKVYPKELVMTDGTLIGDLAPPGEYDAKKAITYSSNNYFYKVFRRVIQPGVHENSFIDSRIGYERWREYVTSFGLGSPLGVDLPNESGGFIPTVGTYDRIYGENRWRFSNIYSLSIGQGELLVTPLQMANLGAILANRGHYFTPHIVKSIDGDTINQSSRKVIPIDQVYYTEVIKGLEQVVRMGSGIRGYVPDLSICGKTSTVQNPHGLDHSGFMGFAPMDDPKIAIAVYVENAGWGGRAAASTASLIIEKYIKGEITRPWVERYVLKGDFSDEG